MTFIGGSSRSNGSGRRSRGSSRNAGDENAGEITPDLVRQVADRVYELWQEDLRLANERSHPGQRQVRHPRRGGF